MASDNAVESFKNEANNLNMTASTKIKKRERRPNYTLEEKALLAELVSQYHHIVEDKRTGGIFYKKKREAWKVITIKYNSKCTTGPRETENLKILYDNMKQQARKNDGECFTNTTLKMRLFKNDHNQNRETVAEEDSIKALESLREEKLQNEHGGNFYKRKTDNPDQVEPLSNPYDSAAVYFRDNVTQRPALDPIQFLDLSLPDGHSGDTKFDTGNNTSEHNSWSSHSQPFTSFSASPEPSNIRLVPKKPMKLLSLEGLKRLYFKRKCQNASLERRKILLEIAHAQQKHSLEMIILRRTLNKQ